jgi:hypothetical protein
MAQPRLSSGQASSRAPARSFYAAAVRGQGALGTAPCPRENRLPIVLVVVLVIVVESGWRIDYEDDDEGEDEGRTGPASRKS